MAKASTLGLIQEGDMVVLRKDKYLQSAQVVLGKRYNLDKSWFNMNGTIGQPYGTTFEATGNHLKPVEKEYEEEADILADAEEGSGKDNRNLLDKRANQKLSKEEIETMRKEGTSGQAIVEQLIENSATFKDKTEFAQQKYIKKKKKKHLNRITVLRPSTRLIAEMYFKKGPTKICNLRMDSLAQILTYGNVRSGSRVLLVESCCGLLTGAVVERLGGCGLVMQLYCGNEPVWQAIKCYNFSKDTLCVLHKFPLKELATVHQKGSNNGASTSSERSHHKRLKSDDGNVQENNPLQTGGPDDPVSQSRDEDLSSSHQGKKELTEQLQPELLAQSDENIDSQSLLQTNSSSSSGEQIMESKEIEEDLCDRENVEEGKEDRESDPSEEYEEVDVDDTQRKGLKRKLDQESRDKEREIKQEERRKKKEEARKILEKGNFDGLIIACRHHPTPILMNLIDLLASSRPIVIFSPYQQPLLDCYMKLRDRGGVANLRFTETWLRQYQVLSNRTHPHINMSNYSGYLLTGITTTFDSQREKTAT